MRYESSQRSTAFALVTYKFIKNNNIKNTTEIVKQ